MGSQQCLGGLSQSSMGVLRDCTTSPINRFAALVLTAVIVPKWANIFWDKTKSIFLKILQRFLVETLLKVLTQFIFIFTF